MLCRGFLAPAVIRRDTPGRYSPPWGGREGMSQHGELAVVQQVKRAEQLTADRDRFTLIGLTSVRAEEQDAIGLEIRLAFLLLCSQPQNTETIHSDTDSRRDRIKTGVNVIVKVLPFISSYFHGCNLIGTTIENSFFA